MLAAFGAYFCMYAFRKPFSVATFENEPLISAGLAYKSALAIAQVLGYALSKFVGIKVIAELRQRYRAWLFIGLIALAELALLGFALAQGHRWNVVFLFLNGLPLGLIWGIVFSYLEGRRFTEILGAGLSASFIVSSGAVKSTGLWLMLGWGVSEFWMPFVTGAVFLLPLLFFVYLLEQIPPPSAEDIRLRTRRAPMGREERRAFFRAFAPGLFLLVAFYTLLTAFRDFRDNFAAEAWQALGFSDTPYIFTVSEIPIAVFVLLMMGATMLIQDNRRAFLMYQWLLLAGVLLVGVSTWFFQAGILNGAIWMVLVGLGLYTAYVPVNSILFDRMIAAFRHQSNAGYLIYVADAFGYLGSVAMLLYKDFGASGLGWLNFLSGAGYVLAIVGGAAILGAIVYFRNRYRMLDAGVLMQPGRVGLKVEG
ncbi:MAG: hypothetical protein H6564_12420 [Lewinellaceae bacterium]|nr:hypothetical protein [Lewinellaceae bacterium]